MNRLLAIFVTIAMHGALSFTVTNVNAAESRDRHLDSQGPINFATRVVVTFAAPESVASSRSKTPSRHDRKVIDLGRVVTDADLKSLEGPGVLAVERDVMLKPLTVPNDPSVASQWDMSDAGSGGSDYSIRAPGAWAITTGDQDLVVAVLDTGITTHSEFSGRVAAGYDFVSDPRMGNDGDGRDGNPADPGDWVTRSENRSGTFWGCGVSDSSWHGTHVAGTIGAKGNNGRGIAGINWSSKILPVRVLGKCGGSGYDIADAIVWASGGTVDGVGNPNPARIINLSLGGSGSCPVYMQSAITEARSNGAMVVVAAGNENENVSLSMPANCEGVIAVAATGRNGKRAYYSNYGTGITIAAPGGNFFSDTEILSTLNAGTRGPGAESYGNYQGTSMAAPHVAGVLSLLLSIKPELVEEEVIDLMQTTATDFPADLSANACSAPGTCGPGIINATALIESVLEERAPQSIEFGALEPRYAGGPSFAPGAFATSGLPISYSSTPTSVCTTDGALITPVSAGTCTITASQGGDADYLPATSAVEELVVLAATRPSVVSDATFPSTPQVGTALLLTEGVWGGTPAPNIAYQWFRCSNAGSAVTSSRGVRGCTSITGATELSYTPMVSDAGRYLRVRQVATNFGGTLTRFTSASSIVSIVPSLLTGPSISVTPRVGRTVKFKSGRYAGTTPLIYAYQWLVCGSPVSASSTRQSGCEEIDGSTFSSFTPLASHRGMHLVVRVTVSNLVGSLTTYSASSVAVQ